MDFIRFLDVYKPYLLTGLSAIVLYKIWKYLRHSGYVSSEGKAVLITGCDSGFGLLLAKRLPILNYTVFALCLDEKSPGAVELSDLGAYIFRCDVTLDSDVEKCKSCIENILKENDYQLWAVVNNAGIAEISFFELLPLSSFQRTMDVNAFGMVRILHAFLPLVRHCSGRVVNVASQAGRIAERTHSAYCMSKFAVVALTDSIRLELRRFGVKVCVIQPTLYKTPITDRTKAAEKITDFWRRAPEHVRKDYGERFFKKNWANHKSRAESEMRVNVDEVIDSMVDAVTAVRPKHVYDCHWVTSFYRCLWTMLPYWVTDELLLSN